MRRRSLDAVNALPQSERAVAAEARSDIERDVREGLTGAPKSLSPRLFYDEEGSRLYERITEQPEYYLTRAERSIFEARAPEVVDLAQREAGKPLTVVELGAGSASKTELLLAALLRRQPTCRDVPVDVSGAALDAAAERLVRRLPAVTVRPIVATHERALSSLSALRSPALVLFIGSSVGNMDDFEAARLLGDLRTAMGPRTALILGADLRKSPDLLLPAYDDAAGVTALFNKNILVRINRELGGRFDSLGSATALAGTTGSRESRCTSKVSPSRTYASIR